MGVTNFREVARRLLGRRQAYRALFCGEDGNLSPYGQRVLEDLARFCRVTRSTAVVSPVSRNIDPYAMAMAEGRREVYLRISEAINMDVSKLMDLSAQNDMSSEG